MHTDGTHCSTHNPERPGVTEKQRRARRQHPEEACHDMSELSSPPKDGYWHFSQVHRVTTDQGLDCRHCHGENGAVPRRKSSDESPDIDSKLRAVPRRTGIAVSPDTAQVLAKRRLLSTLSANSSL